MQSKYAQTVLRGPARGGGPRAPAQCGDRRQPDGQIGGKRGRKPQETGFDAGKKTKGVKRHVLVDTLGLMLRVVIHPVYRTRFPGQ